jgi:hypothetical protein
MHVNREPQKGAESHRFDRDLSGEKRACQNEGALCRECLERPYHVSTGYVRQRQIDQEVEGAAVGNPQAFSAGSSRADTKRLY